MTACGGPPVAHRPLSRGPEEASNGNARSARKRRSRKFEGQSRPDGASRRPRQAGRHRPGRAPRRARSAGRARGRRTGRSHRRDGPGRAGRGEGRHRATRRGRSPRATRRGWPDRPSGAADNKWSVEKSYCNPAIIEYREELRNAVPRDEICAMQNDVSLHVFPYALDKIGPVFSKDELPPEWVEDMIRRQHIHYLYSDARKVDENPAITPFFDTLLLERGTMRVYRFKTAEQLPPKQ